MPSRTAMLPNIIKKSDPGTQFCHFVWSYFKGDAFRATLMENNLIQCCKVRLKWPKISVLLFNFWWTQWKLDRKVPVPFFRRGRSYWLLAVSVLISAQLKFPIYVQYYRYTNARFYSTLYHCPDFSMASFYSTIKLHWRMERKRKTTPSYESFCQHSKL